METLIRLSSNFGSQIKELGVKVSSRDVRTKQPSDRLNERDSRLSARIIRAATAGEILFDTSGYFHDFVHQIEYAIIQLLLEHFSVEELPHVSSVFVNRSVQFCDPDFVCCIYSTSQIGAIRSSIRLIASHDFGRLSNHLDEIFLTISLNREKRVCLVTEPLLQGLVRSVSSSELSKKQLHFCLLSDDPFTAVIHLRMPPVTSSYAAITSKQTLKSKGKDSTMSIRVERAGSEQVHGLYSFSYYSPNATINSKGAALRSPNSTYISRDGYVISRQQKEICLSPNSTTIISLVKAETVASSPGNVVQVNEALSTSAASLDISSHNIGDISPIITTAMTPASAIESTVVGTVDNAIVNRNGDEIKDPTSTVYRWLISNPSLDTNYYTCSTVDPSPLPPALGWRPCGASCLGKLPGPQLSISMSDDDGSSDSESDGSEIADDAIKSDAEADLDHEGIAKIGIKKIKKKLNRRRCGNQVALSPGSFPPCLLELSTLPRLIPIVEVESTAAILACRRAVNRKVLMRRVVHLQRTPAILAGGGAPASQGVENGSSFSEHTAIATDCIVHDSNSSSAAHTALSDYNIRESALCDEKLLMHLERFKTAEAMQKSKIGDIADRISWLADVTDTDDLLNGFPCESAQEAEDGKEMEAFEAQWDLKKILTRSTTPTTLVNTICSLAVKTFKATVALKLVEEPSKEREDNSVEEKRTVRKVSSMPSLIDSISGGQVPIQMPGQGSDRKHRRSHSQVPSQSQSIFQWPVKVSAFLSTVNSGEENYDDQHPHLTVKSISAWPDSTKGSVRPQQNYLTQTPTVSDSSYSETNPPSHDTDPSPGLQPPCMTRAGTDAEQGGREREVGGTSSLADILESLLPVERLLHSYSIVDVIGVQMRGSPGSSSSSSSSSTNNKGGSSNTNSSNSPAAEKVQYVIRVSLRDSECTTAVAAVASTKSVNGSYSANTTSSSPLTPHSVPGDRSARDRTGYTPESADLEEVGPIPLSSHKSYQSRRETLFLKKSRQSLGESIIRIALLFAAAVFVTNCTD
jgi:hypothetical protein